MDGDLTGFSACVKSIAALHGAEAGDPDLYCGGMDCCIAIGLEFTGDYVRNSCMGKSNSDRVCLL